MNRNLARSRFPRTDRRGRRIPRTWRSFVLAPLAEPLEDRTLLSGLDWSQVGPGLEAIFNHLQTSADEHLLAPTNSDQYALPLVGTALGQPNDPVGQVFANLASNQIPAAFQQTPTGPQDVVNELKAALQAYNPQVSNPINSDTESTFTVQVPMTAPLSEQVALQLGLPGLGVFGVSASQAVNAHLQFSMDLAFGLDQNGVFVDPKQNNAGNPLLQLEVKADLAGFPGVAANLNGVPVQVTDSSQNPSQLDVPVLFNSSSQTPIHNFGAANLDQINFANSALGDINLHYATTVADALPLTLDLSVHWPLSSQQPNVGPLDALADGAAPTVTLVAGADLNALTTDLNAKTSPIIQAIDQKIKPLQDVVDFFYQPIPVLSGLGITALPIDLLKQFLPSQDQGYLTDLDVLHDFLDGVGNFSIPQGPQLTFAVSTPQVDPRQGLTLPALAAALEAQAQQQISSINQQLMDHFLQQLGQDLDGTIVLPVLADPALAFEALLTGDNVALFQYTMNPPNLQAKNIELGPPIPIAPPFPVLLKLVANFGLTAGFTLGYDTYGFHNNANDPRDGVFLADASAQLTGGIGLTGELDAGIIQAGATGSIDMSFGVTGINTKAPDTHSVTTVDQNNQAQSKTVLQLDDFNNDVKDGGPFCPFTIGGSLDLSLSISVTIGVSPFSISFNVPIGDVTLFDFTCPSCQPPVAPQLGEMVTDLNNPQIPGLQPYVANIQQELPNTTQLVVLDMGDFASRRQNVNDQGATSEDFEISLPTDPQAIAAHALEVSAYGAVEDIPGADNGNTTIVMLDDQSTHQPPLPVRVVVDQGVAANAFFLGGPLGNQFEYLGNGDTYLKGGTWNSANGDPAQLKQPLQTLNTLVGGFGKNTLVGGDLSVAGYDVEKMPVWNVLVANPGEILGSGQDGGGPDLLQAGTAGATLKGGGLGGDTLEGSSNPLAESDPNSNNPSIPSHYVMIAGKDEKNLGPDVMDGGYGQYDFEWQEGAGPLTINGNDLGDQPSDKELDVWGGQANETWTIGPEGVGQGVKVTGQDSNQKSIAQIDAFGVQTVSVDATDQHNSGGETYIVNDLSTTGVGQVNVNLHQWTTSPDANADHVTVNGPAGDDTVVLATQAFVTGHTADGQPIYGQQWTDMQISTTITNPGPVPSQTVSYRIDTALPKSSDTLNVNTFGGADTVDIHDTQPDQTSVSTGAGDDTITVGGGNASLDDIEGPLSIDAGSGQNQITFGDGASLTGDILTLTTNQVPAHAGQGASGPTGFLLRCQGQVLPSQPGGEGPSYRYPMDIAFWASGGDFSRGVSLVGTSSADPNHPDQIYVQGVLPNAPTTVQTWGLDDRVYAGFDGGPNGATSDPNSTLDDLDSPLTVVDKNGATTDLRVDDEGTARPDTYNVDAIQVTRQNAPATIQYQSLGQLVVVAAAHEDNTLTVTGTASGTDTTVDAGDGNNIIAVADPSHTLDEILGPLTINGGAGTDPLTIDDSGNGQAQSYQLTATQMDRVGQPLIQVGFHRISSLTFHASENANTNSIAVSGTPAAVPVDIQTGQGGATLDVSSLDNIQGPLTFHWTQGTKTVSVQDLTAAGSSVYQVLPDRIQRTGAATIQFDDINASPYTTDPLSSIFLAAGQLHPAEVDVPETILATPLNVFLGTASNEVVVGAPQNSLDAIQGQLNIQGSGTTAAVLDDQDAPQGRNYRLDAGSLLFNTSLPAILFGSLSGLTLNGASTSQTSVYAAAPGDAVTLDLGPGTNSVVVGSSPGEQLAPIQAQVIVNGQSGTDTLTLNDQGTPPSMLAYTLTSQSVSRPGVVVAYSNLAKVTLNGSPGPTFYQVQSIDPKTQVQLVAQGLDNFLIGPNTTNLWSLSGTDSGSLDGGVTFSSVQNLIGGTGLDAFDFAPGAIVTGTVNGGGGGNWLDYSALTTPVAVNLSAGTATGVGGGIANIQDVRGGQGGNTLIGGSQPNILIGGAGADVIQGGSGRSILIGDGGPDLITGGSGDAILIGGLTDDDPSSLTNDLALESILAEWNSPGSYKTRINHIRNGGGLNGSNRLAWKITVHDDGMPNKLIGGPGQNWFFKGAHDKIVNKKKGERVN